MQTCATTTTCTTTCTTPEWADTLCAPRVAMLWRILPRVVAAYRYPGSAGREAAEDSGDSDRMAEADTTSARLLGAWALRLRRRRSTHPAWWVALWAFERGATPGGRELGFGLAQRHGRLWPGRRGAQAE